MRPSKFKADQFIVGYALDCRPLLEKHRDRLREFGLKPRERRVKDWTIAPKGNPIDRAVARHAELLRQGKAPPAGIPSEPRQAMSPLEFARQWLSARKLAPDEQKRDAQPAAVTTAGPARSLGNDQPKGPEPRRTRRKAVPLVPAPGREQSTRSEVAYAQTYRAGTFALSDGLNGS